jgi:7-carboxy-7-deazaguanine synthase
VKTYKVKEIFGPTLQGEGTYSGSVVSFLRFAGCNKWTGLEKDRPSSVCSFCDTDFRGGSSLTKDEIVAKLKDIGVTNVVISGGEPTLQLTEDLLLALFGSGFKLMLETNGSKNIDHLEHFFKHITMSPKQSFEDTKLTFAHDLKLLYPSQQPYITIEAFKEFDFKKGFLQPCMDNNYKLNLSMAIQKLYDNPRWRLSLQTHKITGVK